VSPRHAALPLATGLVCGGLASRIGGMISAPYAAILGTLVVYPAPVAVWRRVPVPRKRSRWRANPWALAGIRALPAAHSSFLTLRWRRQSRANPSPNSDSLVTAKKTGNFVDLRGRSGGLSPKMTCDQRL